MAPDASVPTMPAWDPTVCPTLGECTPMNAMLLDAPTGIEFVGGGNERLIGVDTTTKEHVVYWVDGVDVGFGELRRFDASYDRILVERTGHHLGYGYNLIACKQSHCEAWTGYDGDVAVPLPDELNARWTSAGCVSGNGIGCLDSDRHWTWSIEPGIVTRPIVRFLSLGDRDFIVLDDDGALLRVKGGVVQSIDPGTASDAGSPSRIVDLAGGTVSWQWIATTSDRRVLLGNVSADPNTPARTLSCMAGDLAWMSWLTGLAVLDGQTLRVVTAGTNTCRKLDVPFAPLGIGQTAGDEDAYFFFDAHHLFAQRNIVYIE